MTPNRNAAWRLLLLLLFLSSQCRPASSYAQTQLPTDSSRSQGSSAPDTLAAIHRLFLSKRGSAKTAAWVGVGLGASCGLIGLGSYGLVNSAKQSTNGKPLEEGPASISLKFSLPGLGIATLGLIRRMRFNRHREAVLVGAYEQGKGLPGSIQRKLKSKHFATQ